MSMRVERESARSAALGHRGQCFSRKPSFRWIRCIVLKFRKHNPSPRENVISPIFLTHFPACKLLHVFFSEKKKRNIGVPTILQEYECGARRLTRMASLQAKLRVEHGINARMHMEHTPSLRICEWSTDYARGAGCFVRTWQAAGSPHFPARLAHGQ